MSNLADFLHFAVIVNAPIASQAFGMVCDNQLRFTNICLFDLIVFSY